MLKGWLSIVPMKLLAGFIPALPDKLHPEGAAGCHVALPIASDVSTLLAANIPPVSFNLGTTNFVLADKVPAITESIVVLPNCMVLFAATFALYPIAVALVNAPVVTSAESPIAVFFEPVVLDESAAYPWAVLKPPVELL